jgi:hypothetical protein
VSTAPIEKSETSISISNGCCRYGKIRIGVEQRWNFKSSNYFFGDASHTNLAFAPTLFTWIRA